MSLVHRLQRGASIATVVREAIDRGLADPIERRRAAGARVLEAPDIDVPDPEGLREELNETRGRRG
jgi:hypothetical protein